MVVSDLPREEDKIDEELLYPTLRKNTRCLIYNDTGELIGDEPIEDLYTEDRMDSPAGTQAAEPVAELPTPAATAQAGLLKRPCAKV
jgi:hypothetical protein